jgi:hypothetical protein
MRPLIHERTKHDLDLELFIAVQVVTLTAQILFQFRSWQISSFALRCSRRAVQLGIVLSP